MEKLGDINSFYRTIIFYSISELTDLASEIKNNIGYLKKMIEKTVALQGNYENNKIFLFIIKFGVQYIRIPFIVFLKDSIFLEIAEKKFAELTNGDKSTFKFILENILEMLIDLESNQINSISAKNFILLYQDLNNTGIHQFMERKLKIKFSIFQTAFEKHFNHTEVLLNTFTEHIKNLPKLNVKSHTILYQLLSEIKIDFEVCKSASEMMIMKSLQEEKKKLLSLFTDDSSKKKIDQETQIIICNDNQEISYANSSFKKNKSIKESKDKKEKPESFKNEDLLNEIIWIKKDGSFFNEEDKREFALNTSSTSLNNNNNNHDNKNYNNNNKISLNNDHKTQKNQINIFQDAAVHQNNSMRPIMNKQKDQTQLENFSSFEYKSHLPFLENLEIEFKNYLFPLNQKNITILKKTICAFLNTNGGRLYLGIRDEDQSVIGIQMNDQAMFNFSKTIQFILEQLTPQINLDECMIHYIPITLGNPKQFLPHLFVIKITIKRGKLNDLYFTNDRVSYKRRNGKNTFLCPNEMKAEIIKRAQLNEKVCERENNEYNKKFAESSENCNNKNDFKRELKNSPLKRNYETAIIRKETK